MRTIRKRLLALLLTVAMLGTLFAGLPIASAASEALGNVTDAAVDGNTLLLTIDSGGSASDLLTLEVCQDNILRVDYSQSLWNPAQTPRLLTLSLLGIPLRQRKSTLPAIPL